MICAFKLITVKNGNNGKAKAIVPLILIIVALTGFVVTSSWQQQKTIKDLRTQLENARKNLGSQINAQAEQIAMRERSILALSEDLLDQNQHLKELEKMLDLEKEILKKEREESMEKVSLLSEKVSQQEQRMDVASKKLKSVDSWNKEMRSYKAKLEQQILELKGLVSEQERQILLFREDVLLRKTLETGDLYQDPITTPPSSGAPEGEPSPTPTVSSAATPYFPESAQQSDLNLR